MTELRWYENVWSNNKIPKNIICLTQFDLGFFGLKVFSLNCFGQVRDKLRLPELKPNSPTYVPDLLPIEPWALKCGWHIDN